MIRKVETKTFILKLKHKVRTHCVNYFNYLYSKIFNSRHFMNSINNFNYRIVVKFKY